MKPLIFNLDIQEDSYESCDLMQGYDYNMQFNITDGYTALDLTGVSIQMQMQKADHKFIIQTEKITVVNNIINVSIDKDLTRVSGKGKLQVVLSKDNRTFGSWVVKCHIKESAINDSDGQSENKVTITEELINKITEANNTKVELDKSIANGDTKKMREDINKNSALLEDITQFKTVEMFGAIGDGVTDDTKAFINCLSQGGNIEINGLKSYRLRNKIFISDNTKINFNNAKIILDFDMTKPTNGYGNNGVFNIKGEMIKEYLIDLSKGVTLDKGYVTISNPNDFKIGDYILVRLDTGIYNINKLTPSVSTIAKVINIVGNNLFIDYMLPKDRWNFSHLNESDFTVKKVIKIKVAENIQINDLQIYDILSDEVVNSNDYQKYSLCALGVNIATNIKVNGVSFKNSVFSTVHSEYVHNSEYKKIKCIKPRKWGGGEGYAIQNISGNNVYGEDIYGDESRHTVDFTSGGYYFFKNIKGYLNKSNEIQFHGNYEHDIHIDNFTGCNTSEINNNRCSFNLGSGEEFGNANTNITFKNSIFTSHNTHTNRFSKNVEYVDSDVVVINPLLDLKVTNCKVLIKNDRWVDKPVKRGSNYTFEIYFKDSKICLPGGLQTKNFDNFIFDNCSLFSEKGNVETNDIITLDNINSIFKDSEIQLGFRVDNMTNDGQINTINFSRNKMYADLNGCIEIKYIQKGVSDIFINDNKLILKGSSNRAGIKFNGTEVKSKVNLIISNNIDKCALTDSAINGITTNSFTSFVVKNNIGITDK